MSRPTNESVAAKLGLTHSGVSRIRSGDRIPHRENMYKIADVYKWSVTDQLNSAQRHTYAEDFEAAIAVSDPVDA